MVVLAKKSSLAFKWRVITRATTGSGSLRRLRILGAAMQSCGLTFSSARALATPSILRGPEGPRRTGYTLKYYGIFLQKKIESQGLHVGRRWLTPSPQGLLLKVATLSSLAALNSVSYSTLNKTSSIYKEEVALISALSSPNGFLAKKRLKASLNYAFFRKLFLKFNLFSAPWLIPQSERYFYFAILRYFLLLSLF